MTIPSWKVYINQKYENASNERSKRQFMGIKLWGEAGFQGYIEAAPGFGKTRIGLEAIQMTTRNNPERSTLVIVPTQLLKDQWEEQIRNWELPNVTVMIVNTAVKFYHNVFLLILDEVHRVPAETFKQIFPRTRYRAMLGLSATLQRMDQKHKILHQYGPTVMSVSLEECREKGWVAKFVEFNFPVKENDEWLGEYEKNETIYKRQLQRFGNDHKLMQACASSMRPRNDPDYYPFAVRFARTLGWRGFDPLAAYRRHQSGIPIKRCWGEDLESRNHPNNIQLRAGMGIRTLQTMMRMLYDSERKIGVAIAISRRLSHMKTLTFGQRTETADKIANSFENGGVYHSNIETEYVDGTKIKTYKTENGANKWLESHPEWRLKSVVGGVYFLEKTVKLAVSVTDQKATVMQDFRDGRVNPLCTAKALDEGVDVPDARLGIIVSRNSNPATQTQRAGRIARSFVYENGTSKISFLVNIYVPDTRDEVWLRKAQIKHRNIVRVSTIDELIAKIEYEQSTYQMVQAVQSLYSSSSPIGVDSGGNVSINFSQVS